MKYIVKEQGHDALVIEQCHGVEAVIAKFYSNSHYALAGVAGVAKHRAEQYAEFMGSQNNPMPSK